MSLTGERRPELTLHPGDDIPQDCAAKNFMLGNLYTHAEGCMRMGLGRSSSLKRTRTVDRVHGTHV